MASTDAPPGAGHMMPGPPGPPQGGPMGAMPPQGPPLGPPPPGHGYSPMPPPQGPPSQNMTPPTAMRPGPSRKVQRYTPQPICEFPVCLIRISQDKPQ